MPRRKFHRIAIEPLKADATALGGLLPPSPRL
jgi:hypothetical protein